MKVLKTTEVAHVSGAGRLPLPPSSGPDLFDSGFIWKPKLVHLPAPRPLDPGFTWKPIPVPGFSGFWR